MNDLKDDHRGHTIFTSASGAPRGPYIASYAVLRIEPNNNYRGVLQGAVARTFLTHDAAMEAAALEARTRLDELLDK